MATSRNDCPIAKLSSAPQIIAAEDEVHCRARRQKAVEASFEEAKAEVGDVGKTALKFSD